MILLVRDFIFQLEVHAYHVDNTRLQMKLETDAKSQHVVLMQLSLIKVHAKHAQNTLEDINIQSQIHQLIDNNKDKEQHAFHVHVIVSVDNIAYQMVSVKPAVISLLQMLKERDAGHLPVILIHQNFNLMVNAQLVQLIIHGMKEHKNAHKQYAQKEVC